jgi:hypothetical protein
MLDETNPRRASQKITVQEMSKPCPLIDITAG